MTQLPTDPTTDRGVQMLADVLTDALGQCTRGKGSERHGRGAPLLQQQWLTLANHHGQGFLSGQAAKKLNEAAALPATRTPQQYEREVLGAIVYAGLAIVHERLREASK